jgi:lysyl-tRNA synthetase class 2
MLADFKDDLQAVFQMGPCFRQGEIGSQHQEEFTMLEWYRLHANYQTILSETIALFHHLQKTLDLKEIRFRGQTINFFQEWEIITVAEAFNQYANCSLEETLKQNTFEEQLTEQVEPNLGLNVPTVLIDYPVEFAALAKVSDQNPNVCERWELYVGGLELANCYSELVDPIEQRSRFEQTIKLRTKNGAELYPIDQLFLHALEHLPSCSGIALGIDRLAMVFTDAQNITEVKFI